MYVYIHWYTYMYRPPRPSHPLPAESAALSGPAGRIPKNLNETHEQVASGLFSPGKLAGTAGPLHFS